MGFCIFRSRAFNLITWQCSRRVPPGDCTGRDRSFNFQYKTPSSGTQHLLVPGVGDPLKFL